MPPADIELVCAPPKRKGGLPAALFFFKKPFLPYDRRLACLQLVNSANRKMGTGRMPVLHTIKKDGPKAVLVNFKIGFAISSREEWQERHRLRRHCCDHHHGEASL